MPFCPPEGARRLPPRRLRGAARRALWALPALRGALALCLALEAGAAWACAAALEGPRASAQAGLAAGYGNSTNRYAHNVLGPLRDNTSLAIGALAPSGGVTCDAEVTLPDDLVFEGVRPILADVTGDGVPDILTTVSHQRLGARVTVYDAAGEELASTPFIGTRYRWLGLIGAADLDGDGAVEIAYIDRPHLAKTLRVWRYEGGALTELAAVAGLTNHRIGEAYISGGIRDCGEGPEIITADGGWSSVMATRLADGALTSRRLGRFAGLQSLGAALACDM